METFRKDGDSQAQRAAVHNIDDRHDPLKMVSQAQRAVVEKFDKRQGEKGKKAGCFTLLKTNY